MSATHVPRGWRERERDQPDRDADAVAAAAEPDQRPSLRHRKPGSPVEREHERAEDDVGDRESGAVGAVGDVTDQDGHGRDGEHGGEVRDAEEEVVRVERVA